MRGLLKVFDQRTQAGVILFGVDTEFTFSGDGIIQPVFLRKGDFVQFNVRDRGPGPEAFDITLERPIEQPKGGKTK